MLTYFDLYLYLYLIYWGYSTCAPVYVVFSNDEKYDWMVMIDVVYRMTTSCVCDEDQNSIYTDETTFLASFLFASLLFKSNDKVFTFLPTETSDGSSATNIELSVKSSGKLLM